MSEQMAIFGEYIAARRKALKLTLKDLAAQLKKSDGVPISLAYPASCPFDSLIYASEIAQRPVRDLNSICHAHVGRISELLARERRGP
jgi:transcriptional regulator with XRE-family HTH domain